MNETTQISVIKLKQPIGEFFVGVIPAEILRKIAYVEPRKLISVKESVDAHYEGINRNLNQDRVKQINRYIRFADASFPNSIIVNINPKQCDESFKIEVENSIGQITIPTDKPIAKIIDGQHRLMGFDDENCKDFDLVVSIFVDLPLESQAILFSTINLRQAKVTSSLMYDLFDVAETPSPQKICHNIAMSLNSEKDSPFYKRIKIAGVNPKMNQELLYKGRITQGTFVERLLQLMTRDADADRNYFLNNKVPPVLDDPKLIFRDLMRERQDHVIHKIMKNYFTAVRDNFPDLWESEDNPLSKTIGYSALMRILPEMIIKGKQQQNLSHEFFDNWLKIAKSKLADPSKEFTFANFPASGAGETKLTKKLKELLDLPE